MNNHDIVERTFGIVAENKPLGQNNILVWAHQKTPWMQGDVQSQLQKLTVESVDASGKKIEATAVTDTAIEAQWRPVDSSWSTAPDVQRGEVVELIRYADMNTYYWRERGDGAVARRLETKRLLVSANREAGIPSPDTHYMIEISGHTGAINITTSKANGEISKYHITLNGAGGAISLGDDEGNEFYLETKEKLIRTRNSSGSMVEMSDKKIGVFCLEDLILVGKEKIIMQAENILIEASENLEVEAGKRIALTAGERFDTTAPIIALNGAIQLNGPISQETTDSNYDATLKGTVTTTVDVIAAGVSLVKHPHKGVERGNDESGSPVPTA